MVIPCYKKNYNGSHSGVICYGMLGSHIFIITFIILLWLMGKHIGLQKCDIHFDALFCHA